MPTGADAQLASVRVARSTIKPITARSKGSSRAVMSTLGLVPEDTIVEDAQHTEELLCRQRCVAALDEAQPRL
jgi:hypothetical protein